MNKKLLPTFFGCLLACLIGSVAFAAEPPAKASTGVMEQGQSSIHAYQDKSGCRHTETKNLRFTPTDIYEGTKRTKLILRETFERSDQDCSEAFSGKVTVEATAYDDAYEHGKPLWSLSTVGWGGDLYEDAGDSFYKVTMPGCCGSSDTDVYFSLHDGKQLFEATEPPMKLQLTHGDAITRDVFVTVEDNSTSLQDAFKATAGSDSALAILYMGSDRQPAGSIVIQGAKGTDCHSDDLSLIVDGKALDEKNVDETRFESATAGLFVEGKLDCIGDKEETLSFDIPIVKGHLSTAGAKSSDPKITFSAGN